MDPIEEKLLEIIERLVRVEEKIILIEEHTNIMNKELGQCKEDIKKLQNNPLMKISWRQMATIIGSTSALVTIIYTLLKTFVFHS